MLKTNNFFAPILAILLLAGLVTAGIYALKVKSPSTPAGKTIQPTKTAPPSPLPQVTVSLEAASKTLTVAQATVVTVRLNGKTAPDALDIVLTFDPSLAKISNLTKGEVYDLYPRFEVADAGKVYISAALSPDKLSAPVSLPTTIATFTLTPNTAGSISLVFDQSKTLLAKQGQPLPFQSQPLIIVSTQ